MLRHLVSVHDTSQMHFSTTPTLLMTIIDTIVEDKSQRYLPPTLFHDTRRTLFYVLLLEFRPSYLSSHTLEVRTQEERIKSAKF